MRAFVVALVLAMLATGPPLASAKASPQKKASTESAKKKATRTLAAVQEVQHVYVDNAVITSTNLVPSWAIAGKKTNAALATELLQAESATIATSAEAATMEKTTAAMQKTRVRRVICFTAALKGATG